METQTQSSETKVVDRAYVERYKGDLFFLIKDYFDSSADTQSTPGAVMLDMVGSVDKPDYLLVVHEKDKKPVGFLIGKLVGNVGRILMAFLGKGLDNKKIVKDGLTLFDAWAKEKGCAASDLYTHRHPKSYKSLQQYGWNHLYTVYRKNYEQPGKPD